MGRAGGGAERGARRSARWRSLRRCAVAALWTLAVGGTAALLLLVPLYADGALAALAADFSAEAAECRTVRRDDRAGLDNCTWASCREGCTSDAYRCTQLHVLYRPHDEDGWRPATLLINIKGCGYPPSVDCANFTAKYGRAGARFPCHWSRAEPGLALPHYSRAEHEAVAMRALALPLAVTLFSAAALCALHCGAGGGRAARRARRRAARAARPPRSHSWESHDDAAPRFSAEPSHIT